MAKEKNYEALNGELEEVLAGLQKPDVDVDEAVALYERGLKLIVELGEYLKKTESRIERLKLAASEAKDDE